MRWPWPPLRRGDLIAIVVGIVIVTLVALSFAFFPNWGRDRGLGPDWECTSIGGADAVCIKKRPAMPAPTPR